MRRIRVKPYEELEEVEGEEIEELEEREEPEKPEEEVLVLGCSWGEIYVFDGNNVRQIAKRSGTVRALAVWRGELYDGGLYKKIYRTLANEVFARTRYGIESLTVWKGELIYCGFDGIRRARDNELLFEPEDFPMALAVWEGELCYGDMMGNIYRLKRNKEWELITKRGFKDVRALAVYEGELYDGGYYEGIYRTGDDRLIARGSGVEALAVWKGKLVDGGGYGRVWKTFEDEIVFNLKRYITYITSMISVPRNVLKPGQRPGRS